jgi:hypothetical protein
MLKLMGVFFIVRCDYDNGVLSDVYFEQVACLLMQWMILHVLFCMEVSVCDGMGH